jgi:outer membrane biogenesis lipoprotein LolB
MKRRTKFLLGAVIALSTAGALYATVGKRYHQHHYAMHQQWRSHHRHCNADGEQRDHNHQHADSTQRR